MKKRTIPIYNMDVWFTNDEADCRSFLKRRGGDESLTDNCKGVWITFKGREDHTYWVLAVYDGDIGTVVHESVHAAWGVLDTCSVKTDVDNDEALAFLAAWFTKTVLKLFPDKPKGPVLQEIA